MGLLSACSRRNLSFPSSLLIPSDLASLNESLLCPDLRTVYKFNFCQYVKELRKESSGELYCLKNIVIFLLDFAKQWVDGADFLHFSLELGQLTISKKIHISIFQSVFYYNRFSYRKHYLYNTPRI